MEKRGVIEVENFLFQEELDFIDSEILSHNIPWHWNPASVTEKFPFFQHVIIPRDDNTRVVSPLYEFFTTIQNRFCAVCEIPMKKIYRQCINLTFTSDNGEYSEPHIDHDFPHKNMIMYLNDDYEMGETVLYNNDLTISKKIEPKKGKVICFDGSIVHGTRWISRGRRIIFVSTFY
tara:strand:+ start:289 stop:816 length:528 start_codon:yes stop_codon:yes gene_type:complete